MNSGVEGPGSYAWNSEVGGPALYACGKSYGPGGQTPCGRAESMLMALRDSNRKLHRRAQEAEWTVLRVLPAWQEISNAIRNKWTPRNIRGMLLVHCLREAEKENRLLKDGSGPATCSDGRGATQDARELVGRMVQILQDVGSGNYTGTRRSEWQRDAEAYLQSPEASEISRRMSRVERWMEELIELVRSGGRVTDRPSPRGGTTAAQPGVRSGRYLPLSDVPTYTFYRRLGSPVYSVEYRTTPWVDADGEPALMVLLCDKFGKPSEDFVPVGVPAGAVSEAAAERGDAR